MQCQSWSALWCYFMTAQMTTWGWMMPGSNCSRRSPGVWRTYLQHRQHLCNISDVLPVQLLEPSLTLNPKFPSPTDWGWKKEITAWVATSVDYASRSITVVSGTDPMWLQKWGALGGANVSWQRFSALPSALAMESARTKLTYTLFYTNRTQKCSNHYCNKIIDVIIGINLPNMK